MTESPIPPQERTVWSLRQLFLFVTFCGLVFALPAAVGTYNDWTAWRRRVPRSENWPRKWPPYVLDAVDRNLIQERDVTVFEEFNPLSGYPASVVIVRNNPDLIRDLALKWGLVRGTNNGSVDPFFHEWLPRSCTPRDFSKCEWYSPPPPADIFSGPRMRTVIVIDPATKNGIIAYRYH